MCFISATESKYYPAKYNAWQITDSSDKHWKATLQWIESKIKRCVKSGESATILQVSE